LLQELIERLLKKVQNVGRGIEKVTEETIKNMQKEMEDINLMSILTLI
jgi:predicted DNA-binding protein